MQTFMPEPSFALSAQVLDRSRLGKQRPEAKQIMLALSRPAYGWTSHPAVKMWRGYRYALSLYGIAICEEWRRRGYRDSLLPEFERWRDELRHTDAIIPAPHWIDDERVMRTHRSNLIRKLPEHYAPLWPDVPPDLAYHWPT